MVTPLTRLIAGVSVPDSPLIREVLEYGQKVSEPSLQSRHEIVTVRSEDWAHKGHRLRPRGGPVGTILRDIGLTAAVSGSNRFEVNGADAALSFFGERFVPGYKAISAVDLLMNAPFEE